MESAQIFLFSLRWFQYSGCAGINLWEVFYKDTMPGLYNSTLYLFLLVF
jgi:hypothetical protein